jgi:ribosomal protein L12E/L44/L45/RPP1/RPP2
MDHGQTMTTAASPSALRYLLAPVVAALLIVGAVLVIGQLLPGNALTKIGLTVVWFVVAGALLRRLADATAPSLQPVFRIAVIVGAVLLVGWYANSFRGKDVQEELIAAPPAAAPAAVPKGAAGEEEEEAAAAEEPAPERTPSGPRLLGSGSFRGIDHSASGRAEVIENDGKFVVQLRDFDVQPGPDYRLYLANGESPDGGKELGGLKGTSGNQRYDVERGDARRYDTVLIWCRAFSVPVAAADVSSSKG